MVAPVEVTSGQASTLYALGYLAMADREDREAVARALQAFLADRLRYEPPAVRGSRPMSPLPERKKEGDR